MISTSTPKVGQTGEQRSMQSDVSMDSDDDRKLEDMPSVESVSETEKEEDFRSFYSCYELGDVLGRGMASIVRKAVNKRTKKEFAVKIVDITTERQTLKEATKLFQETHDEVKILKLVQGHPSIISLIDFFETQTYLFVVFEMAPAGELFDVLTKAVTLSEKRTKRYMRQIIDGLLHMHEKNIIHRDMKLENILAIDQDRIVLSDFGFARVVHPTEELCDLCGTPGYLAPEVLKCQMFDDAHGYNKEVDLWACGVIMYTMLAGYAPFYHRRQMIMLRMIQEGKFEFNPEQWDVIGNDAKDLIRNLLVLDPKQRLTAKEALDHPFLAQMVMEEPGRKMSPRRMFKKSIWCVRFLLRLQRIRVLNREFDRATLRKRPFRDRQIRHETEATVFLVFGHWVNRGYYESRDMLFANRSRPKARKIEATI